MWKTKLSVIKTIFTVLKIVIIIIVSYYILFVSLEAFNSFVSAIGAAFFAGGLLYVILFPKKLLARLNRSDDMKATILQAKLDAIPKIEPPCVVSIYRPSRLSSEPASVNIYLHEVKIGEVKNEKTFSFSTHYARNELKLIYEADGTIIKEHFLAEAGGNLRFKINYRERILEKN